MPPAGTGARSLPDDRYIPPPLLVEAPAPVDLADIAAMCQVAADYVANDNWAQARRIMGAVDRLQLAYDRWSVRSGPDPFLAFVRFVRSDLLIGPHHRVLSKAFRRIAKRELLRLMIFMPPGHSKSLMASILLPAWLYGLNPKGRILAVSHSSGFVKGFGRAIKDLVATAQYQRLFPRVKMRSDVKAANTWATTAGGEYQGIGVHTGAAGRRADSLGCIDDPISEQDAYSAVKRGRVNDWYPGGFRSRMMPQTPIVLMMTRWHTVDLAGHLLQQAEASTKAEKWEIIKIPAELTREAADLLNAANDNAGLRPGDAPFEALWSRDELATIKATVPPSVWAALYQQEPTDMDGGILPREAWRVWPSSRPMPNLLHLLMCWDTAYEESEENDYTAATVWGVFLNDQTGRNEIMLLGRMKERLSFPRLRIRAAEYYQAYHQSTIGPVDTCLIEPKATGKPLAQELRRAGVPVQEFRLTRNDRGQEVGKIPRAHAASVVLCSGSVWYPEGATWAADVVDECAAFPRGAHDDLTDTCTMAWVHLRRVWWVHDTADAGDVYMTRTPLRGAAITDDNLDDHEDPDDSDDFRRTRKAA